MFIKIKSLRINTDKIVQYYTSLNQNHLPTIWISFVNCEDDQPLTFDTIEEAKEALKNLDAAVELTQGE